MKNIFLPLIGIGILIFSCKKETTTVTNVEEEIKTSPTAGKPNCTGNNWQFDNPFYRGYCEDGFNDIPPLSYNNKVYVFHPAYPGNTGQVEVKIYNGVSWTSVMSNVPDVYPLCSAYFGFTIGNKGYLVSLTTTFEYTFDNNTWALLEGFPGAYRTHAATFSIGTKGYIVGGSSATSSTINHYDTWEFDPALDQWTQKASLPRGAARTATGFNFGNKGYIVNGFNRNGNTVVYFKDLFEYDPVQDEWNYKSFFPGASRRNTSVFVIGSSVYAGAGRGELPYPNSNLKDFYRYNPTNNSWQQVADIDPFDHKDFSKYGFTINNRGYVVFDSHTSDPDYYMIKYTPKSCIVSDTP